MGSRLSNKREDRKLFRWANAGERTGSCVDESDALAELIAPQKVKGFTGLKIIVLRDNNRQIPVYSGWVSSSSGSTVGKLKKIDHPGKYFVAGTSNPELFGTILKGILRDGISVGYQETPDKFDKVFKIVEPLPDDSARALSSCMDDLSSSLSK
jgi:hypothetical protein